MSKHHDGGMTPDELSEQAGSMVAHSAFEAMEKAPTQAERYKILRGALEDVAGPESSPAVRDGFAVRLVALTDQAMRK